MCYIELAAIKHNNSSCVTRFAARNNAYDGAQEFWITIRETAERTCETSFEEIHRTTGKAPRVERIDEATHLPAAWRQASEKPQFQFSGDKFAALDGMSKRDTQEKNLQMADPKHDRYAQDSNGHMGSPCICQPKKWIGDHFYSSTFWIAFSLTQRIELLNISKLYKFESNHDGTSLAINICITIWIYMLYLL